MKKHLTITALAALLVLTGCAGTTSPEPNGAAAPVEEEAATPTDLTGTWLQTNNDDPNRYQQATIKGKTITIDWVVKDTDTTALYWAGTYTAPTDASDPYTWDSKNDTTKTEKALLASGDPKKAFTYSDGTISYETSVMGTTTTVKLERE